MANEHSELIARHIRGEATPQEAEELSRLLESAPELAQELLAAAELERDLHDVYKGGKGAKLRRRTSSGPVKLPRAKKFGSPSVAWSISIAATVVLAVLIVLINRTSPVIGHIVTVARDASLLRNGKPVPLAPHTAVRSGDVLRVPARATVTFDYLDHTRMQVGAGSTEETIAHLDEDGGKRVRLDKGLLSADVMKQPEGQPMLLTTSRATAEVLGTQLQLSAEHDSTRLDVLEGKVRLRRMADSASALVSTGQFVVAGKDAEFSAQPIQPNAKIIVTCDDKYEIYLNGSLLGQREWAKGILIFDAQTYHVALRRGPNVIAVKGMNIDFIAGLIAEIQIGSKRVLTNKSWKVSQSAGTGWNQLKFDASKWADATEFGTNRMEQARKHARASGFPEDSDAEWIWTENNYFSPNSDNTTYFRLDLDAAPFIQ